MSTLLDFRHPGEKFKYLGVTFIVIHVHDGKAEEEFAESCGLDMTFEPSMMAEYIDGRGQVHEQKFQHMHLPALKAENSDTGPIRTLNAIIRDELLEINKKRSFSMQKGYVDGVDDMFNHLNKRLAGVPIDAGKPL